MDSLVNYCLAIIKKKKSLSARQFAAAECEMCICTGGSPERDEIAYSNTTLKKHEKQTIKCDVKHIAMHLCITLNFSFSRNLCAV